MFKLNFKKRSFEFAVREKEMVPFTLTQPLMRHMSMAQSLEFRIMQLTGQEGRRKHMMVGTQLTYSNLR